MYESTKHFHNLLKPPALLLFIFFIAGIYAGDRLPDIGTYKLPIFTGFTCSFILAWLLKRQLTFCCTLLIFFCFALFSIQAKVYPKILNNHISCYYNIKNTIVRGKIVSFGRHYKRKVKTIILCKQILLPDKNLKQVSGKLELSIYFSSGKLPQYGDLIEFKSIVRPAQNFKNPGAFDYARYFKLMGLSGKAYSSQKNIIILKKEKPANLFFGILRTIEQIRAKFYYFISEQTRASEYPEYAEILAALITGKSELIDHNIRESFSKVGISHLFAISGLHLAIVALIFYSIAYHCLSFFPKYLISGKAKKLAGVIILFPLLVYAVFSGFSPSTQRAFIMSAVVISALISEKEKDILSTISIAGIIILIMEPATLFSISFQLSFIAVFFIIAGLSLIKNYALVFTPTLKGKALMLLCVSFFAGIGTAPLIAHYFHIISIIQVISNLFFIPFIGFIILPFGLTALILFPFIPQLSTWIIYAAHYLMTICIRSSEIISEIPFSWIRIMDFDVSKISAVYMLMLLIYTGIKKYTKVFTVTLILFSIILISIFIENSLFKSPENTMLISLLDVGQGNSTLIETPQGQNILVDGGGFPGSSFDTGKFIIAPFLWKKKIDRLDMVILSHPESDHLNGLVYILDNFQVDKLIKNTDHANLIAYRKMIEICEKKKISIIELSDTSAEFITGDARLFFFARRNSLTDQSLNNNSLVFKINFKNFSMLFPGDIMKMREKNLISEHKPGLYSDILLSPHHGSSSSSTLKFLRKVKPKTIIISCGRNNSYNFPHSEVLKRYNSINARIFRTDKDGAVFITTDGDSYRITSFADDHLH